MPHPAPLAQGGNRLSGPCPSKTGCLKPLSPGRGGGVGAPGTDRAPSPEPGAPDDTEQPATNAAERLAALIDLAREHDDDLSYIEVELLEAVSRRLVLRETPAPPPTQGRRGRVHRD